MIETCASCGYTGEKLDGPIDPYGVSTSSCWKAYCDLMAKEFGNPESLKYHRMTVDAYMVQHSSDKKRSARQSSWVHLVGLYIMVELKAESKFVGKVLAEITREKRDYRSLEFGKIAYHRNVGTLMVGHIDAEYGRLAWEWASDVWNSWKEYHPEIKDFANAYIKKYS